MKIKVNDSKKAVKIKQTSSAKKLSQEDFSNGIGANFAQELKIDHLEPITFAGIFHSAVKGIKSTGGRPGRISDTSRKKIPISEIEWKDLEKISVTLRKLGANVSTGQVAGLLIENSLAQIKPTLEAINTEYTRLQVAANAKTELKSLEPIARMLEEELMKKRLSELIPGLDLSGENKRVHK